MAHHSSRSGAPSNDKKGRHSSAQKKAARAAREQSERSARRAAEGKRDDNGASRPAKSPRWSDETKQARDARSDYSPSSTRRTGSSSGGNARWSASKSSGPRRSGPGSYDGRGGTDSRGRGNGGWQTRTDDRRPQGRSTGQRWEEVHERAQREGPKTRRPDHRENGMRQHREESWGRPDRSDRAGTTRRPSDRDRATREMNRTERSSTYRQPQDRDRGSDNQAPAQRNAAHRSDGSSGRASTAAASAARPSATTTPAEVTEDNGFAALGLHADLVAALARMGIVTPFPIQSATIPDALAGRDLLGRGQTGSGKTMAFGLPMLHRLAEGGRARPHRPHAVILTPTRELAMQIVEALRPLMSSLRLRHQLIAGGMSYTPQLRSLDDGVDVLVATPGRLSDLIERGAANLSDVKITVLDEADHMAEMGFVEAISEILDLTPSGGQRLLFSATLDHGVDKVAKSYLVDPITHSTNDARASVSTMDHHLFLVHPHDKKDITAAIANRSGRTVVFVRTKLGADRVALQLRESGVFAAALHGGLNQAQRTRVLEGFKSGELPVLVATDVAARGIHVDDVSLVLQADPPADHKDYLHRSGRTARAGEDGVVVTLALPHQRKQVTRLLDSAGVQTTAVMVGPSDEAVISTAGGRMPSGEAIPQARLDAVLRPPRRGGRPPQRGGGPRRDGGSRHSGGPRR
ncbi:MAG: DEAD/DEAH box helicase, partial [Ornithinimicrobium sp.]